VQAIPSSQSRTCTQPDAGSQESAVQPLPSSADARDERQTLDCLLEGDSEKEIAARLGLSPATVHEYVTALYRRFGVHSRGQLLAHVLKRSRLPRT
jgi:DNA-binding CsgD family transcriptional regulator